MTDFLDSSVFLHVQICEMTSFKLSEQPDFPPSKILGFWVKFLHNSLLVNWHERQNLINSLITTQSIMAVNTNSCYLHFR